MYTGNLFSAREAYEAGLLSKVVAVDEFDKAVAAMVADLMASSPEAIRHLKVILNETRPLSSMTDAYLTMLQPHVKKRLEAFSRR
jgi:enoyl-CoA hydratase/carnithine racemase